MYGWGQPGILVDIMEYGHDCSLFSRSLNIIEIKKDETMRIITTELIIKYNNSN